MTIYLFIYFGNTIAEQTQLTKLFLLVSTSKAGSQLCQGFHLLTSEIEQGTFAQRILLGLSHNWESYGTFETWIKSTMLHSCKSSIPHEYKIRNVLWTSPKTFIKKGLQTFLKLWDQMKTTLFHNLAPFTQRQSQWEKKTKKQKQSGKKGKPKSSSRVP
jgi:hypothetical protein